MCSQILDRLRMGVRRFPLSCLPCLPPAQYLKRSTDGSPLGKGRLEEQAAYSTACWRRYVADWSIRKGRLYLTRLHGRIHLAQPGPLEASWYTGELVIQHGEVVVPGDLGFDRLREREQRLRVEAGRVVGERWIDHRNHPSARRFNPIFLRSAPDPERTAGPEGEA